MKAEELEEMRKECTDKTMGYCAFCSFKKQCVKIAVRLPNHPEKLTDSDIQRLAEEDSNG